MKDWRIVKDTIIRELGINCAARMPLKKEYVNTVDSLFTLENVNQCVKKVSFVGQGKLVIKTWEIEKHLEQGVTYPFTDLIKAGIGDCHAMGQQPITFLREVLAVMMYPPLADDPRFPPDVVARAKELLAVCEGGSVGAYSNKQGIELIRKHVAEYITQRDGGIPADYNDIILASGSTDAVRAVMRFLNQSIDGKTPGVLCPIPQYPLYTGTAAEIGMQYVGYYLDEDNAWAMDIGELKRAVNEARTICNPRILVITNPGNPAGQVLTRRNVEDVIRFAHEERLFIIADEVYQRNVYDADSEFHSFKRVLVEMGPPFCHMEIATFMSASKGWFGECGLRGGYVELYNFRPEVLALFKNLITIVSCPSVIGQAALDCAIRPPREGDHSYPKFLEEKTLILQSLAARAKIAADGFNAMEGVTCNIVQGAMYAFPKLTLPAKAIAKAEAEGEAPDSFYACQLLEKTGVCVLPGSGFSQKPGTFHIRATILPLPDKLVLMMQRIAQFHKQFMLEYK